MNKTTNYTSAPADIEEALENAAVIHDFLPSPSELIRKTEKEKITIAIDKRSLELYKRYARKHDAKYQSMINGVLSAYAERFLDK
jgi:predicted DNA binding CopG/RHH family protein